MKTRQRVQQQLQGGIKEFQSTSITSLMSNAVGLFGSGSYYKIGVAENSGQTIEINSKQHSIDVKFNNRTFSSSLSVSYKTSTDNLSFL